MYRQLVYFHHPTDHDRPKAITCFLYYVWSIYVSSFNSLARPGSIVVMVAIFLFTFVSCVNVFHQNNEETTFFFSLKNGKSLKNVGKKGYFKLVNNPFTPTVSFCYLFFSVCCTYKYIWDFFPFKKSTCSVQPALYHYPMCLLSSLLCKSKTRSWRPPRWSRYFFCTASSLSPPPTCSRVLFLSSLFLMRGFTQYQSHDWLELFMVLVTKRDKDSKRIFIKKIVDVNRAKVLIKIHGHKFLRFHAD